VAPQQGDLLNVTGGSFSVVGGAVVPITAIAYSAPAAGKAVGQSRVSSSGSFAIINGLADATTAANFSVSSKLGIASLNDGVPLESRTVKTSLSKVGNSLFLNVSRKAFAEFGGSKNVAATGALLDGALASPNGAVSNLIDLLDVAGSDAAITATLSALNPGIYAELGNLGVDRLRNLQAGLSNHLDMLALDTVNQSSLSLGVKSVESGAAPATGVAAAVEQSRVWTTAYGGWSKRDASVTVGAAGYSLNNYGDVSGVETQFGTITLGITGAVSSATADFGGAGGRVTTDSWHTGLYGSVPAGVLVFNASFAYGQADSTITRNVNVAGGGVSSSRAEGSEWTGQLGVALPLRSKDGSTVLTPSIHLLHANARQDAFSESSLGGLEARVSGSTTKSTAIRTGVQAAKITKLAKKPTRLTASLDWVHSLDSSLTDVDIALAGAGTTNARFSGSKSSHDTIRAGVGCEVAFTERVRFRVNVDERFQGGVNSTFGSVSVGLQF
jgi:uncharacterized protein with beta-barrel porin domain